MNMKKKLVILAGAVLAVVFFGKTIASSVGVDHPISEEWTIQEDKIKEIGLLGFTQNIDIEVKQTASTETKVQVKGVVPEKIAKDLKKEKFENGKLNVTLGSTSAIGVSITPDDTENIKATILLGKNAKVSKYLFDGSSAVTVKIPEEFDGTYKLETNNEGEIKQIPDTKKTENTLLEVNTVGDISITK